MSGQNNVGQFLLDLQEKHGLSAVKMAARLGIDPPILSKLKAGKIPLGPTYMIDIHEEFGLSIKDIKTLAGLEKSTEEVSNV